MNVPASSSNFTCDEYSTLCISFSIFDRRCVTVEIGLPIRGVTRNLVQEVFSILGVLFLSLLCSLSAYRKHLIKWSSACMSVDQTSDSVNADGLCEVNSGELTSFLFLLWNSLRWQFFIRTFLVTYLSLALWSSDISNWEVWNFLLSCWPVFRKLIYGVCCNLHCFCEQICFQRFGLFHYSQNVTTEHQCCAACWCKYSCNFKLCLQLCMWKCRAIRPLMHVFQQQMPIEMSCIICGQLISFFTAADI